MLRPVKYTVFGRLFLSFLCCAAIFHAFPSTCHAQFDDPLLGPNQSISTTPDNSVSTDSVQMEPWLADLFRCGPPLSSLSSPATPPAGTLTLAKLTKSSALTDDDEISAAINASSNELILQGFETPQVEQSYLAQDPILQPEPMHAAQEIDVDLDGQPDELPKTLAAKLWRDQQNFYSPTSLMMIGGGLGVGAIFANTNLDDGIQRHLHSSLHHANTDEWLETLHANKEFGDGRITLPIFAGAWAVSHLLPDMPYSENVGTWGQRSIRGFVAGAPAVIFLQMATGASRPSETRHTSEWEPFQDNNGVSGHAFMGALPFITAAKMTDSRGLKTLFYAGSALAPLSRTADGAHYPSQVALGWWMAYVAATAVHATDRPGSNWSLYPTATSSSTGMAFEYRY